MTQAKHTPLPWKTISPGHGHKSEYLCVQIGSDDTYATLEMLPEDAKFIVLACNAHYDLLAACERMVNHIDHVGDDDDLMGCRQALLDAIAKAKGE